MNYLGLDIGTSAVKAALIDEDGASIAEADAKLGRQQPNPGWSEQDPDTWVQAVEKCCAALRLSAPQHLRMVQAIGLSGQMHGATVLGANGRPLRPAILWDDGRSVAECAAINAAVADIETRAGILAMPGFTAPKLLWLARHEPAAHEKIAHILLPKDYVRLALTGEYATDMTDAAGTLWLNQAGRDWDGALCEASRTEMAWLPRLMEGTEISGYLRPTMAERLGLPTGIPVSAGGGDAAAGALGIGAVEEGDAFASLGTSGQLFVATNAYRAAPGSAVHAYAHCVPGRWFQMACMLNGARPLDWFASLANRPIADLLGEAETAKDPPLFLPYLSGERTPHNDMNIRGAFFGLTPETTDATSMRAVVEGIAYSFCDAKACLAAAGTALSCIGAIGGGTRSAFLLQTMADAMGVTINRYADSTLGPALGAARTAMVASGTHSLSGVAVTPALDQVFEPDPARHEAHRERHRLWRALYQALQPFAMGHGPALSQEQNNDHLLR